MLVLETVDGGVLMLVLETVEGGVLVCGHQHNPRLSKVRKQEARTGHLVLWIVTTFTTMSLLPILNFNIDTTQMYTKFWVFKPSVSTLN